MSDETASFGGQSPRFGGNRNINPKGSLPKLDKIFTLDPNTSFLGPNSTKNIGAKTPKMPNLQI